jgi:hypothetical protein
MGRACSTNGEKRNVYRILVGKAQEIIKDRGARASFMTHTYTYIHTIHTY